MAVIDLDGLTKRYRGLTAVDDLTLTLQPGRVTGFVGANGAGKTTTIRMILGLTRPTAGRATIDGQVYSEITDPARSVGAMVDPNVFHPNRSGRNSLRVIARGARIPDQRVDHVLELVDLRAQARRRTGSYSTGQRQRLALAAALLGDPATLILDEPGNGLDPQGIHWLRQLIRAMAAERRTILISSHLLAELAQTVDDVVIIDRGRLITHQPMADLLAQAHGSSLEDVYLNITNPDTSPEDPS